MTNLREKKKQDRQLRIKKAAIELFGTIGYEATTITKIAEKANLGVGTFYNYYKSKDQVLLSMISDKSEEFNIALDYAVKNRNSNILYSINLLVDIYYESFSTYSKLLWREFISNIFRNNTDIVNTIMDIDYLFVSKLKELIIHMKEDCVIKKDADELGTANTLYSIMLFQLIMYVLEENMDIINSRRMLNDKFKVVISGLEELSYNK